MFPFIPLQCSFILPCYFIIEAMLFFPVLEIPDVSLFECSRGLFFLNFSDLFFLCSTHSLHSFLLIVSMFFLILKK